MPLRARQTSRNKTLSHLRGEKTSVICSGFYTRRVKEAIHIRLHPDYINRDNGIKVPEAWMPKIKKHNNRRSVRQRTAEGANHWGKQQGSKCANQSCWKKKQNKTTIHSRASCFIRSRITSRPHRLKKTSSMQSKRRDLHHTWLHRETNEKLSFFFNSFIILLFNGKKIENDKCQERRIGNGNREGERKIWNGKWNRNFFCLRSTAK